jgi:phage baseplate assembly protein W
MAGERAARTRYTGPAFPFGPRAVDNFGPKDDVQVIYTSLVNIISTPKGSIPYNLELGSWVPYLLFEPNDEITRSLVRYFTEKDLAEQEPRIVVRSVYTDQPDDYSIVVTVGFSLVGDPAARVYNAPIQYNLAA